MAKERYSFQALGVDKLRATFKAIADAARDATNEVRELAALFRQKRNRAKRRRRALRAAGGQAGFC